MFSGSPVPLNSDDEPGVNSLDAMLPPVPNIYFELTAAFNATQPVVALASGQAVVYYRVAIMSKEGD